MLSTESPRNSSRSFVGMPPASWAKLRWVSARTRSSGSRSTPRSASSVLAASFLSIVTREFAQRGPAGVDGFFVGVAGVVGKGNSALGTEPLAVLAAHGVERQVQHYGVHDRVEQVDRVILDDGNGVLILVGLVPLEGVGVSVEFGDLDGEVLGERLEAAHAFALHRTRDGAGDEDAVHHRFQ